MKGNTKILFVCTDPAPGMFPFASKIINVLTSSLVNYEFYGVFTNKNSLSYSHYLDPKIQSRNFIFIDSSSNKVKSIFEKIYNYQVTCEINKLINKHNIKIIYCLNTEFCIWQYLKTIQRSIKVIYTVHDLLPHEVDRKGNFKNQLIAKMINNGVAQNIRNINILTTSSHMQYKKLKIKFPNKSIYYHPFPSLVTSNIIEGDQRCTELERIDKYILFFGRIEPYKGVELLYNTFLNSDYLYNNYYLVIAGQGPLYFERNVAKEKKVIYINRYILDSEIKTLFMDSSSVIYPYISATQSGVLSLAYYFKVPLVVSNIPFFVENTTPNENAFVFEKDNNQSLLEAIINSLKVKFEDKQNETYKEKYSDNALAISLQNILKELS